MVRFDSRIASAPDAGKAIWHQIPVLPGPHILNFLWWFVANQVVRWYHQNFRSIRYDLIFSPGINCWDADAIVVHIVFHEYYRLVRADLRLRNAPLRSWAMLIHRRCYYYLIMILERSVYPNARVSLAAVSELTAREITAHFGRQDVTVIPNAVDHTRFNPPERLRRRESARRELEIPESEIVLLLVGNDWKKKGLGTLLNAAAANRQFPLRVLIVGRDDRAPFLRANSKSRLERSRVLSRPVARYPEILRRGRYLRRPFPSRFVCLASYRGHGLWASGDHQRKQRRFADHHAWCRRFRPR